MLNKNTVWCNLYKL